MFKKLLLALLSAVVMACGTVQVPPSMLVYPLDPKTDLTSTRPGWEQPFLPAPDCSSQPEPSIHPPLPVKPYTAEEVIALARTAGRYLPPIGKSGPGWVQTKDKGAVSPAVYAEQLTYIETFLAQYGYSLREGPLGTIARLRPRNIPCTPLTVPSLKQVPPDWHIRAEWVKSPLWRGNPLMSRWMSRRPFETARNVTFQGQPSDSFSRWWESAGDHWVNIEWRDAQRAQPRTSFFRTPVIASADMKPMLQPILADAPGGSLIHFKAPGGVGVSMPMSFGCGPEVQRNPLCALDPDHPDCKKSSGGANESNTGIKYATSACDSTTGCLRKGKFLLDLTPWKACVGQNGGFNGWFGAESCILIKSENEGNDGKLSMSESLEMSSGLTIFTFPINLVEVQAMSQYTTTGGPKAHPPKFGGLLTTLGQSTKCCDPIDGPGATLPIGGPLVLAISSKLLIDIDAGQMNVTADAPPNDCPKGMNKVLGIQGTATAGAQAQFDAALTAYVAKAGISGRIVFADDTLSGSVQTDADMGGNRLRVTPAMTYEMRRLDGSLSVFVEVDYFVDTKRWSIELASWEGYGTSQSLGNKAGETSACPDPKVECTPSS